jgi:DNA helicase II / ATP-dependent DNA helicase PcrA
MSDVQLATRALGTWRSRLDATLSTSLFEQFAATALPDYHVRGAVLDLLNLGEGRDCCYDRPGIGLAYAAWYHPRRVHEWVRRLLPVMAGRREPLELVDLGAGTGAVLWAASLSRAGLAAAGVAVPEQLSVVQVDASPYMVATGQALWEGLTKDFPEIDTRSVEVSWNTLTWPEVVGLGPRADSWVLAGHLFDATQVTAPAEAAALISRTVIGLKAARLWLAVPEQKRLVLEETVAELVPLGWEEGDEMPRAPAVWTGQLTQVGEWRRRVGDAAGLPPGLQKAPSWTGERARSAMVEHGGTARSQLFTLGPQGLALDRAQDETARPTDQMTLIIGAAGSGKSTVLVERLARTIEQPVAGRGAIHALVTTYNIEMVDQLARWFEARIATRSGGIKPTGSYGSWKFQLPGGAVTHSAWFVNWDKLPRRLFGIHTPAQGPEVVLPGKLAFLLSTGSSESPAPRDEVVTPEFLAAELRRVIYGLDATTIERYLEIFRQGRRKPLRENGRRYAWKILMEDPRPLTFQHRWIEVLDTHRRTIQAGEPVTLGGDDAPPYTHVFIDECQDFTPSDFRIAASLVPDANRIAATGDGAQSMHLAGSFEIPRTIRRRRWISHDLRLSYRMPARLAEAVAPLAHALSENARVTPGRDSELSVGIPSGTVLGVLGYRPVVLVGGTNLSGDLHDVLKRFHEVWSARTSRVCVADGNAAREFTATVRASAQPGSIVKAESMRRIKGLERDCVVWLTSAHWASDEAAIEFVYTVLTRSRRLAVIVIDPSSTPPDIGRAVAMLRRDRLLFWDQEAEDAFDGLVGSH